MNNRNKMLQLVLSDDKLRSFYDYSANEFLTIQDALNSENPIVVTVALIISEVEKKSNKGTFKETYNEIISYLNQNIL